MSHPLDGARLKVVRAQQHLGTLIDAIQRYMQTDPYTFFSQHNPEAWGGTASITDQPDPMFSTYVGDCLGNLRCALDYIVWAMATRHVGRLLTPPPFGDDKLYFPIFMDPAKCAKALNGLSKYKIPTAAIDELRDVQPFNRPNHPLWLLYLLVNEDKHRLPLLALGQVQTSAVAVIAKDSAFGPALYTDPAMKRATGDDDMDVYVGASVFVALQHVAVKHEPVDMALSRILKCVADIIPRFDNFV